MENQGCVCYSYNVLVYLPNARYALVRPDKSSYSKVSLNDNLKKLLNRSFFDSIIKKLELNTGNIITYFVEKINAKLLKKYFEGLKFVFSVGLNKLDQNKLKKPSEDELNDIIEGKHEAYTERV